MDFKAEVIYAIQDEFNLDLGIVQPYHLMDMEYVLLHEIFGDKIPHAAFFLLFTQMPPLDFPHVYRSEVGIFVSFDVLLGFIEVKRKLDELEGCQIHELPIYTYVMYDKSTDCYKIGQSVRPEFREKTLQSEKPTVKTILLLKQNKEHELHALFKHRRIRGEWFKLDANDLLLLIEKYKFTTVY